MEVDFEKWWSYDQIGWLALLSGTKTEMNGKLQGYLDQREPWGLNEACCDEMVDLVAGRGERSRGVKENLN